MASTIGDHAGAQGRLPFQLRRVGGAGRLTLIAETVLGWVHVDRLELEIPEAEGAGFDPAQAAERYQRRRTQLVVAALRVDPRAIEARVAAAAAPLALQGVTALSARVVIRSPDGARGARAPESRRRADTARGIPERADGHVSITARVADGLTAADVSFRILCAPSGLGIRILAADVRVHGHLPTPGPVLAHRILATILAAPDVDAAAPAGDAGLPRVRGLGDIELDPLPALLWRLLPPRGWRLPAIGGVELVAARIARSGLAVSYAPAGHRLLEEPPGDVAAEAAALVVAHDAMHTADEMLRRGQLDEAMRGYRALLAAGGPDQPVLLGRILAIAAARPTWFVDGLELARQALVRWPDYGPAHATLASIALAKGDARDAAAHLGLLAEAGAEAGDDDAAALAALAAARLLRVLDPRAATALYEAALAHHPGHPEAVDALAERYGEEGRWHDLVRLHRARLAATTDRSRAVKDHLRLAEILATRLADPPGACIELERARELAPDDVAVHQALAELAEASGDDAEAAAALAEVARLARDRRDGRGEGQAWARRAVLLDRGGDAAGAGDAWASALAASPDDLEVLRGAAGARSRRGDHAGAAELWRKVLGAGIAPGDAAAAALELARALIELGDHGAAREALADAARGPAETAALAHTLLAELHGRRGDDDPRLAAAELDAAIGALIAAAEQAFGGAIPDEPDPEHDPGGDGERMLGRAAALALERARLLDGLGDGPGALADLRRAHRLAASRARAVARDAARALYARTAPDPEAQRQWLDALLEALPPADERARLLVQRARLRLAESPAAPDAALADLGEALADDAASDGDRAEALAIQAVILADRGDRKGSAQALARRAGLPEGRVHRAAAEVDAAAAWLDAEEPAAALPHAVRAAGLLDQGGGGDDLPADLGRRILDTLAEAAWRQRAWGELVRAAEGTPWPAATLRYRLAVASEKLGDPDRARAELDAVLADEATPTELRSLAHRLLAELCERAGDVLSAARSLEAFAGDPTTTVSPTARADSWYRAAELYRRAGSPDEHLDDAARCLEGALRLVEDHLPALDALEMVERALGNLERVAVILGRKIAASARRPGRQKALLARLATLQLELGRPEIALEAYRRALEIDADYRPALRFVADQARGGGEVAEAAALYERLAGALPGDDDDEAADVLAARTSAADALAELIAETSGGDAAPGVTSPPERGGGAPESRGAAPVGRGARTRAAALQRQAGDARDAGRLDLAIEHLGAAAELEPRDPELLRDLAELHAERGDWAALAEALQRLAGVLGESPAGDARTAGPRRAEVLLELADVCYDRLGDLGRARAAMRTAAEAMGPGARRDATLRLLASESFTHGEFAGALAAYESIAPARRTATDLLAMATAHHRLGRDRTAIVMLEEARTTGQLSDEGAMLLFALHTERGRKADLAAALENAAAAAPPPEARARLLEALALYRDQIADRDGTERVAARLQEIGTGAGTGSGTGAGTGKGTGAATAAVAAYDAAAAMAAAKKAFDAGPMARTVSDEWELPTMAATSAAAADASDLAASAARTAAPEARAAELEAAAKDAAAIGDERAAADHLADALAARVAAGASAAEALRLVAELEAAATDAPDVVVRALFAASARAPSALAVILLRRAAAAAEHGLGDDMIAADALARAHSLALDDPEILEELIAVLTRTGDVIRIADHCERTARATTGRASARAFLRLGLVHRDAFNDPRRSAEDFAAAHAADPDFPDVWLPLANARAADDDLVGARALYERALAGAPLTDNERGWATTRLEALGRDPDVVSGEIQRRTEEVMAAVAETLTDMMTAVAAGVTEAVVDAVAGPEPAAVAARSRTEDLPAEPVPPLDPDALAAIYESAGDWDALTELLGQQIVATDDRRQRAVLWYRRARLYRDTLHREAETYRCLREAHACDPDDAEIAHALRAIAMARGEWALAAQLLYREISAAGSDRDRGALHLELALVYDEKLLEPDQARVNYEQSLALDPGIPAAPRPLARIYELAARHGDAARTWERAAEVAGPLERAPLLLRASAAAGRAGDLAGARRLAEVAALAADAADDATVAREARNEVARLAPADERPERSLAAATTDDERISALENALVAAQARGDTEAADRHAGALLDLDPSNGLAFRHLAGNAEGRGDWPMLTALLTARAMVIADPPERATLWFEIGRVHELHRGDLAAATAAYDRALDADADHPGALDARATLAFREQDWERADALFARIQPARSSMSRELVLLRRVAIAEGRGRYDQALAVAREAAAAEGASRDAFSAAVKLGVRIGDYQAAAIAARAALDLVSPDDVAGLAEAHLDLADLLHMAGDPDRATELFEQVLTEDPRNLRALTSLADLHQQQGHVQAAARALRTLAGIADVPARKAELVYRLGEMHLRAGEPLDADDAFLRASDLDPGHLPTLRRLLDVYWRADEPGSLLDVATDLAHQSQLLVPGTDRHTLGRVIVATAASAALHLAARITAFLGDDAAGLVAQALAEIGPEHREITLDATAAGLRELARKGEGPRVSAIVDALADLSGIEEAQEDAIAAALTG